MLPASLLARVRRKETLSIAIAPSTEIASLGSCPEYGKSVRISARRKMTNVLPRFLFFFSLEFFVSLEATTAREEEEEEEEEDWPFLFLHRNVLKLFNSSIVLMNWNTVSMRSHEMLPPDNHLSISIVASSLSFISFNVSVETIPIGAALLFFNVVVEAIAFLGVAEGWRSLLRCQLLKLASEICHLQHDLLLFVVNWCWYILLPWNKSEENKSPAFPFCHINNSCHFLNEIGLLFDI